MPKEIVQEGHPVLRKKAQEVPVLDIKTPGIKRLIRDMKEALTGQGDGVGLAAPQIGVPLRIFIVAGDVFKMNRRRVALPTDTEAPAKTRPSAGPRLPDVVFINPVITKISKTKLWLDEGCLSVRGLYGKIRRADKVTLKAMDEDGRPVTRGASGLLAEIFQHETDHLNGILFIDKAKNLQKVDIPENLKS